MKRGTSIAVSAAVVAALGLAYVLVEVFKPFESKPEDAVLADPFPALEHLVSRDAAEVTRLSLRAPGIAAVVFERESGGFKLAEPKIRDPRLLADKVSEAFGAIARIIPDELIHDPAADGELHVSDYGLDVPTVAEARFPDGSVFILELGAKSPSGLRYARLPGDGRVWALPGWSSAPLVRELADFRDASLPTIDPNDLVEFAVSGSEAKAAVRVVFREGETGDFHGDSLRLVSPYKAPLPIDPDSYNKLMKGLPVFSIASFIDEATPLSTYGLDTPRIDILLRDSETELRILVGKALVNGTERYAKLASEPRIFTVAAADLKFALELEPFSLVGKLPLLVSIDTVEEVAVEAAGKRRVLRIERGPVPAEADAEREETYYAGNRKVENGDFRKAYQEVIGLPLEAALPSDLARAAASQSVPEMVVRFKRTNDAPDLVFQYYRASLDFLAFKSEGGFEFAISSAKAREHLARLDTLFAE